MIIYKITNTINEKIYVGCTRKTLEERFEWHWRRRKDERHLTRAMTKYGRDKFIIEKIDDATSEEDMFLKEIFWIKELNSNDFNVGYNMTIGGDNPPIKRGKDHPLYGKKNPKASEYGKKRKGCKLSDETIEKIRIKSTGRLHTEESKKKMSEVRKKMWESGKYSSNEYRDKISKSKSGVPSEKRKPIYCINNGKTYPCTRFACEELGVQEANVNTVLKGKYKHTKGYAFRYA